jgi:methionyl aminopeptidase
MVVTAAQDIDAAALAAERVVIVHQRLVEFLKAGQTLADIDDFVGKTLEDLRCKSAFLRYKIPGHPPFPSHSCLSVNECIVHGTHNMRQEPLVPGDIISIDIGVIHRGWYGDAAWTYAIEHADDMALQLMASGKESLRRGIEAVQVDRPLVDWAKAVQDHVEGECGFHLVRGLGGHGYGRKLHNPPFVSNVMPKHNAEWPDAWKTFQPGMLLALEPMLALGTASIQSEPRKWPIYTADLSLSVHYEADVLVTQEGPRNLTQTMADLPDIVG